MPENLILKRLVDLVPPPTHPRNAADGKNWQRVQNELSLQLPEGWKLLGEMYGSGTFRDTSSGPSYLWVYNPLSPKFARHVRSRCDAQRDTEAFHDMAFELHPFYPDEDGFFPLGEDDCENTLWYETKDGPPSSWPIVIWGGYGSDRVAKYSLSIADFLVECVSGNIVEYKMLFSGAGAFLSDRPV